MPAQATLAIARKLDKEDELASFRRQFALPRGNGRALTYMSGHSLGLMPKKAREIVSIELDAWATLAVAAHFDPVSHWFDYHKRLTAPLARLIGARQKEVVAMNSLTVNLQLMLSTFYRPKGRRRKILIEEGAFPSDRYAVTSHLKLHDRDAADDLIVVKAKNPSKGICPSDLQQCLKTHGNDIAVVLLPGVQYLSGQVIDMQACTRIAHQFGCVIGFDLAHAIGNVPMRMHDWQVDFAIWCSYKYLNGGPGAIGGCFVHQVHAEQPNLPRLGGWWGHNEARRFRMETEFHPIASAAGWQLSNPPILAMAPLRASLQIFDVVGRRKLRTKSRRMTAYMQAVLEDLCGGAIQIITPHGADQRGAQLSLRLNSAVIDARTAARELAEIGIVVDAREPDILRLAAAPLYTRYQDVLATARGLARVLK